MPCVIESDRSAIEAKLHAFHLARGDSSVPQEASHVHDGSAFVAVVIPGASVIMMAQNYWVMRRFQEVQRDFIDMEQAAPRSVQQIA